MKTLLSALIISFSATALAYSQWMDLAEGKGSVYAVKAGSLATTKDPDGKKIYYVTGRTTNKKKVELNFWHVTEEDCQKEQGELVISDLKGTRLYAHDFVFGAGSIASDIAQAICTSAIRNL